MFSDTIFSRNLSDLTSARYSNIRTYTYNQDNSFSETARALLADRLFDNRNDVFLRQFSVRVWRDSRNDLDALAFSAFDLPSIHNINIKNYDSINIDDFERLFEQYVPHSRDGFSLYEPLTVFFKQHKVHARVYISEQLHSSFVFIHKLSLSKYHLIQSLIPVLLPWFFKNKPVTDEERELLHALTETSPTKYIEWMQNYIERQDFRSEFIRENLADFEKYVTTEERDKIVNELSSIESNIAYYQDEITNYMKRRETQLYILAGFDEKHRGDNPESEIMDYFLANKGLNLVSVNGTDIEFEVLTLLDAFDADLYENYQENERSVINDPHTYEFGPWATYSVEDGRLLLDALFATQELKVQMRAAFRVSFDEGRVRSRQEFTDYALTRGVPNPHFYYYNCFGNNQADLVNAVRSRDYVGTVAVCQSSVGNLNLSETMNLKNFIHDLFLSTTKVIQLPTKEMITVSDAITWLKNRKEGTNE